MDTKDFLKILKDRKTTVISVTLIFVIIGLSLTLLQPLKYRSKSRLLILQPNTSVDAYTIARSNEYVGGLISEVIYSGAFLESLKNSDLNYDRSYFNGTYKQNIKKWKKTVFARSGGDTGIIDIEIYHTNPEEAKKISLAVNQLIISGNSPYKFDAKQSSINIIDQPVVSSFPVKPSIPANFLISLLFGFLAGCSYVYLFPKERVSEKLIKEIFGEEKIKVNPESNSLRVAPDVLVNAYNHNVTPDNLPFLNQDSAAENTYQATPEETLGQRKVSYSFRGNINNVLGE